MGIVGMLAGFFGSAAAYGAASTYNSIQRKKQLNEALERQRKEKARREAELAAQKRVQEEVEKKEAQALVELCNGFQEVNKYFIDELVKKRACPSCYYYDDHFFPNCKNPANLIVKDGTIYLCTDMKTCDCWKCGYDENYKWIHGYNKFHSALSFSDTEEYKKECERLLSGYTALETDEEIEAFRKEFRNPYITLKGEDE